MRLKRSRKFMFVALGELAAAVAVTRFLKASAADAYTLRLSVGSNAESANGQAAIRLARAVEQRSNGQLKIDVYPSGQLASEQAAIDGLATGVVDIALESTGFLEPLSPPFQVFAMPFLFKNAATAFRVLDGPLGREFFAPLESKGLLGLGWGFGGFKVLATTTKTIVSPDDMKGLRFRVQAGAIYAATYQAMGAIPVAIDLSEVYTALSQHTVDGIDNTLDTIASAKFYTIIKHIALSNHIWAGDVIIGGKRKIDALPPPLQKILKDETRAVVPYWRSLINQKTAGNIEFLKKNGVAFSEVQYPAFRKAVDPVYALLQSKLGGDILDRVSRAANT